MHPLLAKPINVPPTHRCVLAVTTAWVLVPAAHATPGDRWLMLSALAASLLHWCWYEHRSWRHGLDLACATVLLVRVAVGGGGTGRWWWQLGLHACMFFFLRRGKQHMLAHRYREHLVSHLLFRYLAFWALYVHVQAPRDVWQCGKLSAAYAVHVAVTYQVATWLLRRRGVGTQGV